MATLAYQTSTKSFPVFEVLRFLFFILIFYLLYICCIFRLGFQVITFIFKSIHYKAQMVAHSFWSIPHYTSLYSFSDNFYTFSFQSQVQA